MSALDGFSMHLTSIVVKDASLFSKYRHVVKNHSNNDSPEASPICCHTTSVERSFG